MSYLPLSPAVKRWSIAKWTQNTSAFCQNWFATTHCKQNWPLSRNLATSRAQFTTTHTCNFHSPRLAIATRSTSPAQTHLCSHPRFSVWWSSWPTWSLYSQIATKIGGFSPIETHCGQITLELLVSHDQIEFQRTSNCGLLLGGLHSGLNHCVAYRTAEGRV